MDIRIVLDLKNVQFFIHKITTCLTLLLSGAEHCCELWYLLIIYAKI